MFNYFDKTGIEWKRKREGRVGGFSYEHGLFHKNITNERDFIWKCASAMHHEPSRLQYHKILSTPINSLKLVKIKTQILYSWNVSKRLQGRAGERKSIKWSFYLLNSFLTPPIMQSTHFHLNICSITHRQESFYFSSCYSFFLLFSFAF